MIPVSSDRGAEQHVAGSENPFFPSFSYRISPMADQFTYSQGVTAPAKRAGGFLRSLWIVPLTKAKIILRDVLALPKVVWNKALGKPQAVGPHDPLGRLLPNSQRLSPNILDETLPPLSGSNPFLDGLDLDLLSGG